MMFRVMMMKSYDDAMVPRAGGLVEELIEKPECAKRLHITPRTLDDWMARGYVPFLKIGKAVRFRWTDVLAHLASRYAVEGGDR
jgi:excisionase family DNA binding protein